MPFPIKDEKATISGFAEIAADFYNWHHELGVRIEHHDDFGDRMIFNGGTRWQIIPTLALHASSGNGFRPPSLGELLAPVIGNPALKPELGVQGDIGVEWSPVENLDLSLAGFYGRYDDLVFVEIAPLVFYNLDNIPNARTRGVEAAARYDISHEWHTGLDLTFLDARDLDTGRDVPLLPDFSGQWWGQWDPDFIPITFRLTAYFRSRYWNDAANDLPSKEVIRFNTLLSYHVTPDFDMYVRAENITDDDSSDAFAQFTAGATVFAGIHIHY